MAGMSAILKVAVAMAGLAAAMAANTPRGGCTVAGCNAGKLGYKKGVWMGNGEAGKKGSGSFNFEGYPQPDDKYIICKENGLKGKDKIKCDPAIKAQQCCSNCARTPGCKYWQFFEDSYPVALPAAGQQCYLLKYGFVPVYKKELDSQASWIGGECNPDSSCNDDPHLVGARGTHFDFSGALGAAFSLVSAEGLAVNAQLGGYRDNRTTLRSWIKEVGIVFKHEGVQHTLRLVARSGKEQERGRHGFMAAIEMDGESVGVPSLGHSLELAGGALRVTFEAEEKKGPYDMDRFSVAMADLLELDVSLRVAHPLLQTPEDAQVHFNLDFKFLQVTPTMHGILGQTYRTEEGRSERSAKFSALNQILGHNFAADSEEGKGFLDGEPDDYRLATLLSTDFKFSSFEAPKKGAVTSEEESVVVANE